jgi:hypothetical protein
MINKRVVVQVFFYAAVLLFGVIVGPPLINSMTGIAHSSDVIATTQEQVAPGSTDAVFTCVIAEVAVIDTRVHVRCYTGYNNGPIVYFAAPTTDTVRVSRLLSTMLTADAAGKLLQVGFDTGANGSAYGCATSNCRPISYLMMLN